MRIDPPKRTQSQFTRGVWKRPAEIFHRYHYIVCGAGSAGSVVAGQLAANPGISVLLLEAGGDDNLEAVMNPDLWQANLGSDRDWGFAAEPNFHLNGRRVPYSMGKVLGGGGSINVGIWSRGHKADWDFFAQAANDPAWNYEAVLEIYRRIENDWTELGPKKSNAPMWIQTARDPHPFFASALESMREQGIDRYDRLSGPLWEAPHGCSYVDEIVHDGVRQSPFRSYVYPKINQPNLTVLTGATAERIIFEGSRAVGVELQYEGRVVQSRAEFDIVLSLGAINTPKILMQSGVGDATALKTVGIKTVQDLPGVGRDMHDHIAIGCAWDSADIDMPTSPRGQAVCFWKTHSAAAVPNALAFANPNVYATPENSSRFDLPAKGWSLFAGMATQGRGEICLTGPRMSDPVQIKTNFLSEPQDVKEMGNVVAMCRAIGNGRALRPFAKREALPGDLPAAEMEKFIRNGVGTFWHQSGGAKMGADKMSVVDSELRVRGIQGLRIADASIMPRVTVGNTMAPCVVIGQRAADMLKSEHGS